MSTSSIRQTRSQSKTATISINFNSIKSIKTQKGPNLQKSSNEIKNHLVHLDLSIPNKKERKSKRKADDSINIESNRKTKKVKQSLDNRDAISDINTPKRQSARLSMSNGKFNKGKIKEKELFPINRSRTLSDSDYEIQSENQNSMRKKSHIRSKSEHKTKSEYLSKRKNNPKQDRNLKDLHNKKDKSLPKLTTRNKTISINNHEVYEDQSLENQSKTKSQNKTGKINNSNKQNDLKSRNISDSEDKNLTSKSNYTPGPEISTTTNRSISRRKSSIRLKSKSPTNERTNFPKVKNTLEDNQLEDLKSNTKIENSTLIRDDHIPENELNLKDVSKIEEKNDNENSNGQIDIQNLIKKKKTPSAKKSKMIIVSRKKTSMGTPFLKPKRILGLKLSLCHSKLIIWRKMLVSEDIKLSKLARIIINCMGWSGYWKFEIFIKGDTIYMEDNKSLSQKKFKKLANSIDIAYYTLEKKQNFKFFYDVDCANWTLDILVEEVYEMNSTNDFGNDKNKALEYAICLGGIGNCPPDEIRNADQYALACEILKTKVPKDEYIRWIDQLGDDFDPEEFDKNSINQCLRACSYDEKGLKADEEDSDLFPY